MLHKIATSKIGKKITKPVVEPLDAATTSKEMAAGVVALEYNVVGSAKVNGGQLLLVNDLPANATSKELLVGDKDSMKDNLIKNAAARSYSEQVSFDSASTMFANGNDWFTARKSKTSNAGVITYLIADDITFIDPNLYSTQSNINSNFYTDTTDAIVIKMVNSGKDQYNAKCRRIAKLAKAFKESVIAQTNDTNPFYFMRLSEIYDRFVDYFLFSNHSVASIKTAEFWIQMRDLIVHGDRAYAPIYQQLYTADFIVKLEDVLGRARIALQGTYYEPIELAETIINGTPSLAPRQNGATRMLIPMYGDNLTTLTNTVINIGRWADPYASHILTPQIALGNPTVIQQQQTFILAHFEAIINRCYSSDNSVIQTALAAFNGVPKIEGLAVSKVRVGTVVAIELSSNVQIARGKITKLAQTREGIVMYGVARSSGAPYSGTNNRGPNAQAYSMIANFNGITSVVCSIPKGVVAQGTCDNAFMQGFGHGGTLVYEADDTHVYYGQSVPTMGRLIASAVGLSNAELLNIKDSEYNVDYLDMSFSPQTGHIIEKLKIKPWSGAKYKYVYGVGLYDTASFFVAHACIHNGDSLLRLTDTDLNTLIATDSNLNIATRVTGGPTSICAALEKFGARGHANTATDAALIELNTMSNVDSAVMILTQTVIDVNPAMDNNAVNVFITNITPSISRYDNFSLGDDSDLEALLNSTYDLGLFYTINKPGTNPANLGLAQFGFDMAVWTPSFNYMFSLLDGNGDKLLSQQYHINFGKAQYLYGITNYSEE